VRKRGGKGKSDEMKEIKMEMNCAVEILTTQVFPSQVALIAFFRDMFLSLKDCSSSTAQSHTCALNSSIGRRFFFILFFIFFT